VSVRTPTETTGVPAGGPDHEDGLSLARRVRLVVVFAALLGVLVVGLVSRRSGGNDAAVTGVSPTTPPPTQAVAERPPTLVDTGEDWNAIVRSITAYDDWLFLHPRPELLDEILLPSAPTYADSKVGLTNLATKGWRYDPPPAPAPVEIVRLNNRVDATTAAVFVRFGPAPQYRVVDRSGAEVANKPATQVGNSVIWTLKLGPDSRWRLADVDPL
jgi:hypothetical protein